MEKGFCGRPVVLRVARPPSREGSAPLFAWGEFRRVDEARDVDLGTSISAQELKSRTKDPKSTKADTLNAPYFEGLVDHENERSSHFIKFFFNNQKKGWNYSWQASKHTTKASHAFFVYIFILETTYPDVTFRCINVHVSPSFVLFCRKRKAGHSGDDEGGEEDDDGGAAGSPRAADGLNGGGGGRKKRRRKMSSPSASSFSSGSSSAVFDPAFPSSYLGRKSSSRPRPAKRKLLSQQQVFAGEGGGGGGGSGLGGGFPSFSNVLSSGFASMFGQFRDEDANSAGAISNDVNSEGQAVLAQQFATTSSGGVTSIEDEYDSEDLDFESATALDAHTIWRISTVLDQLHTVLNADGTADVLGMSQIALDSFLNDLNLLGDDFLLDDQPAALMDQSLDLDYDVGLGGSSPREHSSSHFLSLEPFEFMMDLPAQSSAAATAAAAGIYNPSQLLTELANYLLEESSLTAKIRQVIAHDKEGRFVGVPDGRRVAFLHVFDHQLRTFLSKKGYTEKDLDQALKAATVQTASSSTSMSPIESFENAAKTLKALDDHINRVVNNSLRIAQRDSPPEFWLSTTAPIVPPALDLSGTWRMDDSLSGAFQELRARRGVPYLVRKMLSYMESHILIEHTPDRVIIRLQSKLFATSEVDYVYDGEEHLWDVAPPIPLARALCLSYRAWIENGEFFRYVHTYSPTERSERIVRKHPSGDRLEFDLIFQQRLGLGSPWENVMTRRGYALRTTRG